MNHIQLYLIAAPSMLARRSSAKTTKPPPRRRTVPGDSAFALDGVTMLLRWSTAALAWAETRARKGAIGIIGFAVLAVGILMQFVGT
jgi:hypothetical protein